MRRGLLVSHRRFGTTFWPRLEWPSLTLKDVANRSLVNFDDHQSALCNIPEERISHSHRYGRLKSRRIRTEFVEQDWGREP